MAVNQSTYLDGLASGYPGMVANGETSDRISRTCEDSAGITFGKAIFRGAAAHGCTATPTAGKLLGISIAHEALGASLTGVVDTFRQYATIPIMTMGVIWVLAGATVAEGDQVYVTSAGALTNVSTSNTILPGWVFDEAAASGAVVKIARR